MYLFRETLSDGNSLTNEPKKLSAPISIRRYSGSTLGEVSSALFNINDRTFIKPTNETTTVSQKKLEKAEAKLREKQEKRARDGVINGENKYEKFWFQLKSIQWNFSRGLVQLEDAVVSQATNKRLLANNENSDSTNKS